MSIRAASEDGKDTKHSAELLDEVENGALDSSKPAQALEAPPLVQALSADARKRIERTLVRKIDFRLLPPVIIMYIMVCEHKSPLLNDYSYVYRTTSTGTTLPPHACLVKSACRQTST